MGKPLLKVAPALLAISLILSIATPLLLGGDGIFERLTDFPAWGLPAALMMIVAAWACNAARVYLLAGALGQTLSYRHAVQTVLAAESAGLATPAGAASPAAYLWFLSRGGLRPSESAAVYAMDSAMDFMFFCLALPIEAVFFASHLSELDLIKPLVYALAGALVLGILFALALRKHRSLAIRLGRLLGNYQRFKPLLFRLGRFLVKLKQSLKLMVSVNHGRLALAGLFCFGHWMFRYGTLAMLVFFTGADIPFSFLLLAQGIILFVGQWTFLPGGGGSVELGMTALLAPYLDTAMIATVLILWRFTSFQFYLLAGLPIIVWASRDELGNGGFIWGRSIRSEDAA